MLESSKPRLLNRDSVERKLKPKGGNSPVSPQLSPGTDSMAGSPVKYNNIAEDTKQNDNEVFDGKKDEGILLDSFGTENDRTSVKFVTTSFPLKAGEEIPGRETPQQKLFRRYGSPQGVETTGEVVLRTGEMSNRTGESGRIVRKESPQTKPRRPVGSARSMGSSLYTSASALSVASSRSHRSSCDIPTGPHTIHLSNARTTTQGPHSSLNSLMGHSGPRDISKTIHHKSAWYHVPGRYRTTEKKLPAKRSQARDEAKVIKKAVAKTEPDPYACFMKSDYRKNNPKNLSAQYQGLSGHTCKKGQLYPPYPRPNQKQYVICEQCQHDANEIITAKERELVGIVEGSLEAEAAGLAPTVNGLTSPDRPKQVSYVIEEVMNPEEIDYTYPHTGTTVTFNDAVVMN